ncbi:MAG: hypothetical protein IJ860_06965 [Eubacterium sp.]|nr:hypothetical protein [Eubacterium sp.]
MAKKKQISRIVHMFVLLICVGVVLFAGVILSARPVSARAKRFNVTLKPAMTSIKVSWPKVKGAAKYRIYRADVTGVETGDEKFPTQGEYRYIRTNKGSTSTSFVDQKLKKSRYYAYLVKVYDKKGRRIASTYADDVYSCACIGLGIPSLGNNGYGENHINTLKKLYLYISADYYGVNAKDIKADVFRKAAGEKQYKKIDSISLRDGAAEYTDKRVKSGKNYSYKTQLFCDSAGKTYRSKMSDKVSIPAVNFSAKYRVKCLTRACTSQNRLEIVLRISNKNKFNGITTVLPKTKGYYDANYYGQKENGEIAAYDFRFTAYSRDNVVWKKIPKGGVKLPAEKPLFLKGEILRREEDTIYFGGSTGKESMIISDGSMFRYDGPGVGDTYVSLDLKKGTGSAYQEYD